MSRHRDVRCMNYSDEYDGYDDVYGHSVEDDYCVSPSAAQFIFDRSKQQNIAAFITEPDIVEDNEDVDDTTSPSKEKKSVLTELEIAKLGSCMDTIKNVIGDTLPESQLKEKIIEANFDPEKALDAILKESPPKNVTEPQMMNKDRIEHYPGAATTKLQSSLFTIPKISFKKQENILENATNNTSLTNNLTSLKNLAIGNPSTSFCSLSDMISNNTKLQSPACTKMVPESNTQQIAFGSLADLTAHHLKKSNFSVDSLKPKEKVNSTNTNFVIPRLSVKKDMGDNACSKKPYQFPSLKNVANVTDKNNSIDSLRKNLSTYLVLSETNVDTQVKSREPKTISLNTVPSDGTRTPSPDNWMIDLSIALKEAEHLTSRNSNPTNSEMNKYISVQKSNSRLNSHALDDDNDMPYVGLPTTLNLIWLRNAKLPHTKVTGSAFSRTLCKTWKSRKPAIKCQDQEYQSIKRFDFSTPYTRA